MASRRTFSYLDGIRGAACLAVVLYHAYLYTGLAGQADREAPLIGLVVGWGWLGVPVFIVLSGYLLMGSVGTDLRFKRGTRTYLARRAKRILPPYYAALLLSLALIAAFPMMQKFSGTQWDTKIPFGLPDIISHALLLQNASPEWIGTINGPLWSVAVEWQIYFLMPLALLPLWRRINANIAVGLVLAVSMIPGFIDFGAYMHPWFVGLFAIGMRAFQLSTRKEPVPWVGRAIALSAVLVLLSFILTRLLSLDNAVLKETSCGAFLALVLIWAGRQNQTPRALRVFDTKPFASFGQISYSVYLLHSPLLGLANLILVPFELNTLLHWVIMTLVAVPASLVICYLFYLAVESHFLNSHQRKFTQKDEVPITRSQSTSQEITRYLAPTQSDC